MKLRIFDNNKVLDITSVIRKLYDIKIGKMPRSCVTKERILVSQQHDLCFAPSHWKDSCDSIAETEGKWPEPVSSVLRWPDTDREEYVPVGKRQV
jgi:hypothetical protein